MVRLLNDFSLMCKNIGGEELCVCDYRVNIYGCPNSDFYVMMTKTLIPICLLVTVMSASFLVYLTKFKKQPFFLNATNGRGLLRPRPLHSYHLLVFAYMLFAGLHLIMLLNEWYPNFKAAEVGNMMANACSAACAMFYPVSIVYSTPNIQFGGRSNFRNLGGIMNTRFVDIVGVLLFLEPIVTLLPLAAITGHYAGIDDIEMADTFFKVLYLAWTGWEFVFLTILAYFWHKLMTTIKDHLSTLKDRDPSGMITNINKEIKKSTKTVTIPVMAIVFGLLIQAIIYIVMSFTYRNQTVYYFVWDLFYYWIEFIAFPILGLFVESFLLYYTIKNYKKSSNNPSAKSSSSSSQAQLNSNSERKTNIDTTIDTIITIPNPTVIHYTSETTETVEIIDNVENTLPSIQET